jgi:hypothetical protein
LRIGEKRIPCAAAPSVVKGGCGTIFSVGRLANADVNCAGLFIASVKSRCQAKTKIFSCTRRTNVLENITRRDGRRAQTEEVKREVAIK